MKAIVKNPMILALLVAIVAMVLSRYIGTAPEVIVPLAWFAILFGILAVIDWLNSRASQKKT